MLLSVVKQKVQLALDELILNERHLLVNGLNERAITTHLANYLAKQFPNYDVDHEYNGNKDVIGGKKRLGNSTVYPDIIIHRRGINTDNLLIIEAKKSLRSGKGQADDAQKIMAYVAKGCEFRYPFGLYLGIGIGNQAGTIRQDWFEGTDSF